MVKITYMNEDKVDLIGEETNTKGTRNGGTANMCKAFEDHYNSGYKQGVQQGIKNLVVSCKELTGLMSDAINQLRKQYDLNEEDATNLAKKYWE